MAKKLGLILAVLMLVVLALPLLSVTPVQAQPGELGDWGDAPEGAIAYPDTATMGQFPTCMVPGPATWVYHGPDPLAWFGITGMLGPGFDLDWETDGNAGLGGFPPYDQDESDLSMDLDSGLLWPGVYTIAELIPGLLIVVPLAIDCPLGYICQPAVWGESASIVVWNMGVIPAYVNVLMDWNQDGMWGGASMCPGGDLAPEHVLVNFPVPPEFLGQLSVLGPPDFLIGPNAGYVWTRFTISPEPVVEDWDGAGEFLYGETEDYLLLIEGLADLSITKSDDPDPVIVGENLTYNITVTNHGPSDATGVAVIDLLPTTAMTYKSDSPSQGTYDSVTGIWDVGNLANGNNATLTLVATAGSTPGLINNYGKVFLNEVDPDTSNNSHIEQTLIIAGVDLEVTKSDAPDPVVAGEDLTYTVTVTNNGPHDATGVTVMEIRSNWVTYKSGTPSQGSYELDTGAWYIGYLASGASATLTLVVTVDSSITGWISNQVKLFLNEADSDGSNNSDEEYTEVIAEADLEVTKTGEPGSVAPGSDLTYTVVVTNHGPSLATEISAADTLPSGVTYKSDTTSQGTYDSGSGAWCVGNLASGESASLTLVVTVDSSTTGTLTNEVAVSGNEDDPDETNNSDTEDTDVIAQADLEVTKTGEPGSVAPGSDVTYTIVVTNHGPSDATGVNVTETLPSGVTYKSDSPSQGTYDSGTGVWDVGNLASGNGATLTLVVTVDSSTTGTLTNDVSAIGEQDDPDPVNNIDTEQSKVSSSTVAAVPAISLWGGVVLAILLSVLMVWTLRRRNRTVSTDGQG